MLKIVIVQNKFSCVLFQLQYRMPDAYDQDGGVNQEKRFSVAVERYRLVFLVLWVINHQSITTISMHPNTS